MSGGRAGQPRADAGRVETDRCRYFLGCLRGSQRRCAPREPRGDPEDSGVHRHAHPYGGIEPDGREQDEARDDRACDCACRVGGVKECDPRADLFVAGDDMARQ